MTPPSLLLKRRRVKKENSHTSSREASEESNAETDVGITEDDEPPVAHEFAKPARRISKGSVGRSMATLHEHKPDSLTDEVDSGTSTYDGDISSATAPSKRHPGMAHCDSTLNSGHPTRTRPASSSASTASPPSSSPPSPVPQPHQPAFHHPAPHGMISKLKAEELQEGVRAMIAGQSSVDGAQRNYRINEPPVGRPIRIYADGVYDLFHYAHALQLRQAKLFFPEVTLVVGVCSDELVLQHKAHPVLNEEERYESVRNCKWVDEVIEDAPWIITEEFLVKHKIDYVAHDEEPYKSAGSDDVYAFVKSIGKFLPTRRTSGISTSELLSRIVDGYRGGEYDNKLEKIGRSDIMSRPGSEAGSQRRLSAGHDALPCGLAQIHLASPDRLTANQN